MNRRNFLAAIAAFPAFARQESPRAAAWQADAHARPLEASGVRQFEITTTIHVLKPSGPTRVWMPMPLAVASYQETMGDTYRAVGGRATMVESEDLDILVADWDEGVDPVLTVANRVRTFDRSSNLDTPTVPPPLDAAPLARYLRPSRFIPVDGIVKEAASEITRGAGTDIERARAIYEWIVDHTFRDASTRGCGTGDIRFMLESGNLGGKCADLNSLFVGLARASGIPARDVWGLRIGASTREQRSLGLSSGNATTAQRCRAEVYLTGYGWVPVDPADVRKVALEEPPGHLAMSDKKVRSARARLFGSWEMNWMAYNTAHDVLLPASKHAAVPFLMYPQAETAAGRLDSLDPESFRYEITSRQVS